jgi:MFS family permease
MRINVNNVRQKMMKRDLIRKAVSIAFIALAAAVLAFAFLAASRHKSADSLGDWLIIASPLIAGAVCAFLSVLLYPTPKAMRPVRRGVLWGSFVGANGFLILLALSLFPRVELISQDGTAYWGLLFCPCFWIGIPSLFVGALVGLVAGLIVNKKKERKRGHH